MKFDFDDILIEAEILTDINSRSEISVYYEDGYLPLFTAPMDTVIGWDNSTIYNENKIRCVIPRTEPYRNKLNSKGKLNNFNEFISYGLDEFKEYFVDGNLPFFGKAYVLIDVANGHMRKVYDLAKKAKGIHGDNLVLMVGNISNPKTYELYSNIGVDFVRIGVGNGGSCLTSEQTSIGYPMASLIKDIRSIANKLVNPSKIVADGGFRKYSDIIKALALGADYVMLGGIFNKALESSGELFVKKNNGEFSTDIRLNDDVNELLTKGMLYKSYRGMSTKEAQKAMGKTNLTTSEGISTKNKVEYTLSSWVENFEAYLKSAMSYTNSRNLEEFIGNVRYNLITENALNRFKK